MRIIVTFVLAVLFITIGVSGQDKIDPRIDVTYSYTNGLAPKVGVRIRKRIERRYFPMQMLSAELFFAEVADSTKIGTVTTNADGLATIELPARLVSLWNDTEEFDIIAEVQASDSVEAASEILSIRKARISLEGTEDDGDRSLSALIEKFEEGQWVPAAEIEVKLFIKRDFGRITFGDDFYETDETGIAQTEFAIDIPGNEEGIITLGAFVEENDEFGNLFAYKDLKWGVPTIDDNREFNERTLWATRDKTPIWLLVFPNLLILGVWGSIGYLVWLIFKIKKSKNEVI